MLQMHVTQPVPPAMEPPVVRQMAAQAGLGSPARPGELSTGWSAILVGGSLLLLGLSYWNCVQRGACRGFWKRV
jgi:hypothetical protein